MIVNAQSTTGGYNNTREGEGEKGREEERQKPTEPDQQQLNNKHRTHTARKEKKNDPGKRK